MYLLQALIVQWCTNINNSERPVDALAENGKLLTHNLKSRDASASKKEISSHMRNQEKDSAWYPKTLYMLWCNI